ncbi:hemicentin 2 [Cichlidogyrus casuarinus]|uniref:Hemicentin 2 n=1 Tax=Cichlidogyrus casuarinus TaxID=1844966 RepID=A0ABD2PV43_9PLAT
MESQYLPPGQTAHLLCDIIGAPAPQFQWEKDGKALRYVPGKFKINQVHWGSELLIESLELSDSGTYTCIGMNDFGTEKTSAELTVSNGERIRLRCNGLNDDFAAGKCNRLDRQIDEKKPDCKLAHDIEI